MLISKEVTVASLRDVEERATKDFEHEGYRVLRVLTIDDLGHDGRRRSWRVSAECVRADGRPS